MVFTSLFPEIKTKGAVVLRNLTCIVFLLFSADSNAYESMWTAFWDDEHYKRGFKDENGVVRIPPKFMGMTQATQFKNIIAVMEEREGGYEAYYLLKNGRRVENVKMFTFDNSFDCESDNKIRYRDKITDDMGYLDGKGNVAIPAIYNAGQPFANGLASVLKGAALICMNGKAFSSENRCEHPRWEGGEKLVINASNEVVLKGHSLGVEIDRYSLAISKNPLSAMGGESLKAVNGKYYNFINTEKHFEQWFHENILSDLSKTSLEAHAFEEVALFKRPAGWYKQPQKQFWDNNYKAVRRALGLLKQENVSFFVTIGSLHQGIFEEEKYHAYYAHCYNQYANRYPTLSVISNHEHEGSNVQNVFEFLKIDDSYKLISMTLRTDKLR